MNFKVVVSDSKTRKAYQKEVEQAASGLIGKKIGDKVSGSFIGLEGYELEIRGGSDKNGFPMRADVEGTARKKLLLTRGVGMKKTKGGLRRRKSVRGNTVSQDIAQINTIVVKQGSKSLDSVFGKAEKPKEKKPEEPKKETPKEEKKAEPKKEAPKEEKPKEEPKAEKAEAKMAVKKVEEVPKEEPKKEESKPKEEKK